MDEKVYKLMGRAGGMNLVFGIISIAVGVGAGIMLIVCGARLLLNKSRMLI